jgi:hypothetical protein
VCCAEDVHYLCSYEEEVYTCSYEEKEEDTCAKDGERILSRPVADVQRLIKCALSLFSLSRSLALSLSLTLSHSTRLYPACSLSLSRALSLSTWSSAA